MKQTGIIRGIDPLGRIVIPKEIRKNLNLNTGDKIEFSVAENNIILNKKVQKFCPRCKKGCIDITDNYCRKCGYSFEIEEEE